MAEAFYIRVPLDDLEQPHWRCLLQEDGGDGAIVLALRLRGLAAKCNHGGLITSHTGEPMPMLQLATYMGYAPQVLEHRIRLLAKYGLAESRQDDCGGVRVVDPVLVAHFSRTAPTQLELTDRQSYSPNQRYSRPLTSAERAHLCRTGELPDDVYRLDKSRLTSRLNVTSNVTTPTQHTVITKCNVSHSNSNSSINSNSSTAVAVAPSSTPLPADHHTAIATLPPEHQDDALQVCLEEPGDPDQKLEALRRFADAVAAGKADTAGYLRQIIRKKQKKQEQAALQVTAQDEAEATAWEWWSGLSEGEQERLALENHSSLLGVPRLTERRKALILLRKQNKQQEAA